MLIFRRILNFNSNSIPRLDIPNKIYTPSKDNSGEYKLIFGKVAPWLKVHDGIGIFHELNCPVKTCELTSDDLRRNVSDLVLFNDRYIPPDGPRPPNQIYALYNMESPPHTTSVLHPGKVFCN